MEEIKFFEADYGIYQLRLAGMGIVMTRVEAEELFVSIGHALQDADKRNEERENNETDSITNSH